MGGPLQVIKFAPAVKKQGRLNAHQLTQGTKTPPVRKGITKKNYWISLQTENRWQNIVSSKSIR